MNYSHGIIRTLSTPRPFEVTYEGLVDELRNCSEEKGCSSLARSLFEEIPLTTLHAAILNNEFDPHLLLRVARIGGIFGEIRNWLEEYCNA